MPRHAHLTLAATLAVLEAAAPDTGPQSDRALVGLALPYGAPGRTSAGVVECSRGVVRYPADVRRVKVFAGHDRNRPVGYVTALEETDAGLRARMHIANTGDGNRVLAEANEGVRDAISVELDDVDVDDRGRIRAAELTGLALVPVPAFDDARLAAERATGDSSGGDSDDENGESQDENDESGDNGAGSGGDSSGAPAGPPATTAARAPVQLVATRGAGRHRNLSLEGACQMVAQRFRGSDRSAASLNAALADITQGSTNWAAVAPYQWLGEVWTPEYQRLDWVNAISSGVLTSMKFVGWKRDTSKNPTIKPYAGNKAEIGTDNNLAFVPIEGTAGRHAVGVDFDRIFLDFGDETVINTWLRLVAQSYAKVLDDAIGAVILAEATDGGYAPDLISAVTVAARTLKTAGARVNWVAVASDLWDALLSISASDAPWWLASSSSVDLAGDVDANKSASINTFPRIFENPAVPDGTVVAGDRRAATQYTPRGNPFTVRAVDLPRGGLDVAVFGYSGELVNDPLGIVSVTVGTAPLP